jgi:Protein of unknown function (DUF2950)
MRSVYSKHEGLEKLRHIAISCAGGAVLLTTSALLSFGHLLAFSALAVPAQLTFTSPEQAANALFAAVRTNSEQRTLSILGVGKEVFSSGDEVRDRKEREQFVEKYQQMHRFVKESDGTMFLYIGAENWPFPFPLVSQNRRWYFDRDLGAQELFFRQIGENETSTIATCHGVVSGSQEMGKLPAPFHGYYFRLMTERTRGRNAGGSIVVAYPAEYRSSGVMTFVATHDGKVYEKDLGPDTAKLANSIDVWQPIVNWHLVQ